MCPTNEHTVGGGDDSNNSEDENNLDNNDGDGGDDSNKDSGGENDDDDDADDADAPDIAFEALKAQVEQSRSSSMNADATDSVGDEVATSEPAIALAIPDPLR